MSSHEYNTGPAGRDLALFAAVHPASGIVPGTQQILNISPLFIRAGPFHSFPAGSLHSSATLGKSLHSLPLACSTTSRADHPDAQHSGTATAWQLREGCRCSPPLPPARALPLGSCDTHQPRKLRLRLVKVGAGRGISHFLLHRPHPASQLGSVHGFLQAP